jgi:hypothetical protein
MVALQEFDEHLNLYIKGLAPVLSKIIEIDLQLEVSNEWVSWR